VGAHAVQCAVEQAVTGERLGFHLPYCIDNGTSGTFGNVSVERLGAIEDR
jgi:hypothetical protein